MEGFAILSIIIGGGLLLFLICAGEEIVKSLKKCPKCLRCLKFSALAVLLLGLFIPHALHHWSLWSLQEETESLRRLATAEETDVNTLQGDMITMKEWSTKVDTEMPWGKFNEEAWQSSYTDTPQFLADCFTWQKKHPEAIEKNEEGYCFSGSTSSGGCSFEMRKKAPDGNVYDVWCSEQKDPTDFIP